LPAFSSDLVAELDRLFPERSPSPDWPDRQIWIEVGKREVVRHLLLRKEIEQDG